jgi:hypothetical protein
MRGAYRKLRIAMPKSIHSKPIVFTSVPLSAGPTAHNKDQRVQENLAMWQLL